MKTGTRHFAAILCVTLTGAAFASAGPAGDSAPVSAISAATSRAQALGIPTLDNMAGDWIPMANVANPPAVHNFNQMLIVGHDLTSFFCNPGGLHPWRMGYPTVKLKVDDREYSAVKTRCYAYRALRRNDSCNGTAVESDTRMVNEERTVLVKISARNTTGVARTIRLALEIPGTPAPDGAGVVNTTRRGGTASVAFPSRKPDSVKNDGKTVRWEWTVALPADGVTEIGFAIGDDDASHEPKTRARVLARAENFNAAFEDCKTVWENRWADAFTPGNRHFSGHLPVLRTPDVALARNYYMGVQTLLALERTQFPVHPRSFITSGERADGTQFFWDASMQSTVWAMIEPAGMKATLRRWLVQNPRGSCVIDIRQTKGFDARKLDSIKGYAFNATNIFRTADDYLRLTGDKAFLDEKLENGRTVLEQMEAFATDWKTLPPGPAGSGLVYYGENNHLLECAPAYVHCVPSLHAQDVWMMRRAADLFDLHGAAGDAARAKTLRDDAAKLLPSVLALYKPGDGVWYAYHRNGKKVELRHCVDFIYIGDALDADLTDKQKREMTAFVKNELFMRDWMRAMSQKDAAAAHSDRPDHGPMGAFDGWIPLTVGAMWRLGDPAGAFAFYDRTAAVTREGPFAQAREFYGPNRNAFDAPVRVAERGGCMKECIAGVAFSDVVIGAFFGFSPESDGNRILRDPETARPFTGELIGVPYRGALYDLSADAKGVRLRKTSSPSR